MIGLETLRDKEAMMQAIVGDRVIIKGRHLGEPEGDGEIIAASRTMGELA